MSATSARVSQVRRGATLMGDMMAALAGLLRLLWPSRNSLGHIAAAQFELEVKQARRASDEKGGAVDNP